MGMRLMLNFLMAKSMKNEPNMQEMIDFIRKTTPAKIAEELASVQPMDEAGKALGKLIEILDEAGPNSVLVITPGKETNE